MHGAFAPAPVLADWGSHVEPAEQLFVARQPVEFPHRLTSGERARTPHDAPACLVEQQAQQVRNAGGRRILLPVLDLVALLARRDDRDQQVGPKRLGRQFARVVARLARGVNERGSQPLSRLASEFDEPPRAQGRVVGRRRCGLDERQQFVPARCARADLRLRASARNRGQNRMFGAQLSSALKSRESEFMQYRSPVGVPKPSGNTCPRCEPQFAHSTSVRVMPRLLSSTSFTASGRTDS